MNVPVALQTVILVAFLCVHTTSAFAYVFGSHKETDGTSNEVRFSSRAVPRIEKQFFPFNTGSSFRTMGFPASWATNSEPR